MPGGEPGRVGHADLRRHLDQLGPVHRPRQSEQQRQGDAAPADPPDPLPQRRRIEAQVADDVGRMPPLVPHRLDGDIVLDLRVGLRVSGDADPGERAAQLGQVLQHVQRAGELARRRVGVAGGHEDVVDPDRRQARHDLVQVRGIADQPRRQVRHDPESLGGQPLGQPERRLQSLGRRRRDRDDDVARHPFEHRFLGARRGQHLVAGLVQQRRDLAQPGPRQPRAGPRAAGSRPRSPARPRDRGPGQQRLKFALQAAGADLP